MRFDESPGLFGCGLGYGTSAEIKCDWCGTIYNEGANNDNEDEIPGEDVTHTTFGGKTICECCFEHVEDAVLNEMGFVLPWFRRIVESKQKQLSRYDAALEHVGA